MQSLKRFYSIAVFFLVLLVFTACGSTTSSGGTSNTPPTATATASNPTPSPTTSSGTVLIHTATAVVDGKSETILTNVQGLTLYHFTSDSQTTSDCTDGCASAWPPLLLSGSGTPSSSQALPGKLTLQMTGNGNQIEYNGHLLYTYSGDTAPGQTHGQGLFGKWYVVTPTLS